MESRGEKILYTSFTSEDYLYYTIRFENTGTASAINVRVNDVLNSKLNENSIKMIGSSHAYILDRIGNTLNWKFDNIQLPPSIANTEIGKGFVTFAIKPKAGYSLGDIIPPFKASDVNKFLASDFLLLKEVTTVLSLPSSS